MSFGFNNYLNNENYWNSLYKNDFSPVVGLPSSQPYKPPDKKIDQLIEEYIKISEYDTSAVKLRNDQSNKKSNEETSQNKTLSTQDKTNMNKFETCVRYAVNGLSKSDPGVSEPPLNTNIKNILLRLAHLLDCLQKPIRVVHAVFITHMIDKFSQWTDSKT